MAAARSTAESVRMPCHGMAYVQWPMLPPLSARMVTLEVSLACLWIVLSSHLSCMCAVPYSSGSRISNGPVHTTRGGLLSAAHGTCGGAAVLHYSINTAGVFNNSCCVTTVLAVTVSWNCRHGDEHGDEHRRPSR
jgi:hypothetical protein